MKLTAGTSGPPEDASEVIDPAYWQAFSYAASINGFRPVGGNRAGLMAYAETARARLIADIDAVFRARCHCTGCPLRGHP